MTILRIVAASLIFCLAAIGAEPIEGVWLMKKQEITGREGTANPMQLRVTQTVQGLEFAYAMIADSAPVVTIRFTAKLDGTECEVNDKSGAVIGSARLKKAGPSEYSLQMRPANRPPSVGMLRVSADRKTLTSESDTDDSRQGRIHAVQVFARN
jgi:hypothetical protein